MKKECEIVRDLLPNYVENLVGTQTKDFIKDHLKTCSECTKILKNMEGNTEANNTVGSNKVENPHTGDSILVYAVAGIIAIIGIATLTKKK